MEIKSSVFALFRWPSRESLPSSRLHVEHRTELTLRRVALTVRAPVGDRYVVEALRKNGYNLGGEQSDTWCFWISLRRAMALWRTVLETMRRTGKLLSELKKQIKLFRKPVKT